MQVKIREDIIIPELFETLPESVILFKPILNDNNEILDFEVGYCNNASSNFLSAPKELVLIQTILTTSLIDEHYKTLLFKQCLQVWKTGKPHEEYFYNDHLKRHFTASRSKIKEGVISVTTDRTEHYKAEKARQEQSDLFTSILNASPDGVMILKSLRNTDGEVIDFLLTHCNQAAFELGRISTASVGKKLLEILPHLRASEQLELHKNVIDTGIPARIETSFRNEVGEEYGWFIVSLMKMGDNVVSTFIDISEKKKNSEKIEEQAELLSSIFEASINGIFACNVIRDKTGSIIDLQVVKVNKAFTRMIGLSAEEAENKSYNVIFPSGREMGFFDLYCEVMETGRSIRKEIFYSDERLVGWYDVSGVKRGNNGIVVTFTNITESKLNKEAIEESSKYLQDVIDSSQTGIALLSPVKNSQNEIIDFRFKIVNETVSQLVGKQPAELINKLHNEVFTGSVSSGIFSKYKLIAEGQESEQRFENYYFGDGLASWIDVAVKRRGEDLLITFLDFTSLKKLQEQIVKAAEKLNTVINSSLAGMFTLQPIFDEDGKLEDFRFVIVNQTVAAYIGEKAENLAGQLGSTYFPAYKTNGLFDIYVDTYFNNNEHRFDFHYEDGHDVYFNIHTIKAGDEILVTFTDHTALKKLQVQLEASISELKKSNSSLEEFAYAASHDLQEPLRKINYFSERLRKGLGERLAEDESRMFERMENAAARMSRLIEDLLTYSQISQNSRSYDTTDLNEVIQQVLADLETRITEKKASIDTCKLPTIYGDPVQLRQLFQNLLSNSLKYSKSDIPPVIAIECNQQVKQVNGEAKNYYQIKISDNGIGFEQEHADRIFKVFQRLHGQSEYPGTGIGLAIVQKVIENHKGFITAEGQPGIGSTFTILLPETH